jgi:probable HAF family extracellular repeat protein
MRPTLLMCWLAVCGMATSRPAPRRRPAFRRSCRPRLELLEDRCCPSTTSYTVTDLGLSPVSYGASGILNLHDTTRLGINNALQVVGEAGTGNPTVAANHAFVYQNGVFTDLGTLGGAASRALAINNAASPEIVGWADTTAVDSSGNPIGHACLWQQNGTGGWSITDLGTLGGNNSAAYAINKSGQVVGTSETASSHAPFLWQNGTITNLNSVVTTYAGSLQSAYGINDQGQITGGLYNQSIYPFPYRGYLLTPSPGNSGTYTVTVLAAGNSNTLGSNAWDLSLITANMGMAINSASQVAGVWLGYAAYWASPTKISTLGNTSKTGGGAFGINSSGEVVGVFGNNSTLVLNAFLMQGKTITNLNSLIPSNSGWNLIEADSINDATTALPSGSIVGYGVLNGQTHMFLAIDPPVDDGSPNGTSLPVAAQPKANGAERPVQAGSLPLALALGSLMASPSPAPAGSDAPRMAFSGQGNGSNALSGDHTQTNPGLWTFSFTVRRAAGNSTLFAQDEDSYGVFCDMAALMLQVN